MAKNCSSCGCKIGFLEFSETIKGHVFCQACAPRQAEVAEQRHCAEQKELQAKRDEVIEAVRAELAASTPTHGDPRYASKLEALQDLLKSGILTLEEFDTLKSTLLQHWSQGEAYARGRFAAMYEHSTELISRTLVAPATAKYPPLALGMIIFVDCESNQFIINTYVDSQARSSALLRSQFRAKFDLETDTCLGVSLFQDVNPPWQKMEWGPFVLV